MNVLISTIPYCFAIDDECYSRWCDLDGLKYREWEKCDFIEVLPVEVRVIRI